MLRAIVLDIEGTTSATSYIYNTLYPYSQERFRSWIAAHRDEPKVRQVLQAAATRAGELNAEEERIVWWLNSWLQDDAKVTELKTLQGWIWAEGFAAGDLHSQFYPDVIPALRRWSKQGRSLWVFSSGSVAAQKAWFAHTHEGDLTLLVDGNFDTENTGSKKETASYRRITSAIGVGETEILFLSDCADELDVAKEAGWHTVGVRRLGEPCLGVGIGNHAEVSSFAELDLSGEAPALVGGSQRHGSGRVNAPSLL
jgi:enolase-phosphatase E1